MANITQKDLKKYLENLNEKELKKEILQLYQKFSVIKEYYQLELSDDSTAVVEQYKKKIYRYYFPKNKIIKRPKAAKMRELISNFKKVTPFSYDVIDLLLYQVETMIEFSALRGYISAGFHQTMVSRYKDALQLIQQEYVKEDFMKRCQKILADARFMRWGTYDELLSQYINYFNKPQIA